MLTAGWYYNVGSQKGGPVTADVLRSMLAGGQLAPSALVWREGLPDWVEARSLSELASGADVVPMAAVAPVPLAPIPVSALPYGAQPVEYFRSSLKDMPPRAANVFKKCATPRGDTVDWPLDDGRVGVFTETMKLRKRMKGAASLYQALLLIYIIGGAIGMIGAAVTVFSRSRAGATEALAFLLIGAAATGIALLLYFARRATLRAKGWGSMTFFVIFTGIAAVYLVIGMIAASSTRDGGVVLLGMLFPVGFATAFAIVSWRANRAIPRFLLQPAWCQELAVLTDK